ncbi:hypothetical protein MICRO8M_70005 [Microbacterium sp. 8M]|nr:hypothetical protein MICRO8M_70005 [Microbacterium sp. 8M]
MVPAAGPGSACPARRPALVRRLRRRHRGRRDGRHDRLGRRRGSPGVRGRRSSADVRTDLGRRLLARRGRACARSGPPRRARAPGRRSGGDLVRRPPRHGARRRVRLGRRAGRRLRRGARPLRGDDDGPRSERPRARRRHRRRASGARRGAAAGRPSRPRDRPGRLDHAARRTGRPRHRRSAVDPSDAAGRRAAHRRQRDDRGRRRIPRRTVPGGCGGQRPHGRARSARAPVRRAERRAARGRRLGDHGRDPDDRAHRRARRGVRSRRCGDGERVRAEAAAGPAVDVVGEPRSRLRGRGFRGPGLRGLQRDPAAGRRLRLRAGTGMGSRRGGQGRSAAARLSSDAIAFDIRGGAGPVTGSAAAGAFGRRLSAPGPCPGADAGPRSGYRDPAVVPGAAGTGSRDRLGAGWGAPPLR